MIALIGYGYWGRNLARNFAQHLTWICDTDPQRRHQAADLYPSARVTDNVDAVLADPGVKAVLIATKAQSHRALALTCIAAGRDVWIEKPVAQDLNEIDDMIHAADRHQRLVFVDHTFVYNPAVQCLRRIDIGRPIYYDSTRISLGLFQPDVDALLDLAIHDLSIIDYLYPDLELQHRDIIRNYHVNDKANQVIVNLQFRNGFTATTNCNWVSPVKKRQIILTGDHRSAVYDDIDVDKIKIYDHGSIDSDYNSNKLGDMMAPRVPTTEALAQARDHFLHCISTRQQPLTSIHRARKIMEWVL
jgi:predicted dehydrogenase